MLSKLEELELGFVKQIEKHWNKWQTIFKDFESAARSGLLEMTARQKREMAAYEEFLERTTQTDFRPTQRLKDLQLAEEIMTAQAE